MDKLILKPTKTLPFICLDPVAKKYEISGQSFPEDPNEAFDPIFEWMENNLDKLDHKMELELQADYFNSASNRLLLKLFRILEKHAGAGKQIEIHWSFEEEEIENDGIIFSRLVNLPFRFIYRKAKN